MLENRDLEQIAMLLEKSAEKTNEKIAGIENKISGIENKISGIENKISGIENKISDMESTISSMENKISDMDEKMSKMQDDILNIQLTIENETNRNIKIIAEGHLDLSRKYNEASTIKAEEELALIRLNTLSEDVRKIKAKLAIA
jgi:chromosome segregation ATPase